MTNKEFIKLVAKYVRKYAKKYGITVYSPIIAQVCLESAFGTSDKVKLGQNYLGLKYRPNRCAIANNQWFEATTTEQREDGSTYKITSRFFKFNNLEECIIGYFQFISIPHYENLKGITEPVLFLQTLKNDNYATDINYVQKNMKLIKEWNLTKFDKMKITTSDDDSITNSDVDKVRVNQKYYRVQVGSFGNKNNAVNMMSKLQNDGYSAIIKYYDNMYHVQVGAFSSRDNAIKLSMKLIQLGYSTYISYS